ncbi:MAG: pantoate--beta-alanine ligase [Frankiales bacterium]|jgi:pantoate--beta-alanine ligase|nr:pantoate--beta-alanine ligase [Frankiales bacterium]
MELAAPSEVTDPQAPPRLADPVVVTTRAEIWDARWRLPGRVAVVPTLGALHEGHVALIRAARKAADAVIVTIFVNPLQFGAGEDLDRYPRDLDADLAICAREGVEVVFAPSVQEMYPEGEPSVRVVAGPLGARFEGSSRPGHFDGVLTVVLKLLHLCQPQIAVFGEKDAQQLTLVRRMVADLDLPVQVLAVPIVREDDGLARSSRNRYLDPEQRESAAVLRRALLAGAAAGESGSSAVLNAAREVLLSEPGVRLDYLRLVTPAFDDVPVAQHGPALLLVAGYVGSTRLIDNIAVTLGQPADQVAP